MSQTVVLTTNTGNGLEDILGSEIRRSKPKAVGIASAFVSVAGVDAMMEMMPKSVSGGVHLIAGTDLSITHPEALELAQRSHWTVRLARRKRGMAIFHPKLFIGADAIGDNGAVERPHFLYIGSANLTKGGLRNNTECGLLVREEASPSGTAEAFQSIWRDAEGLTPQRLAEYAAIFTARNRSRTVRDIREFGVADEQEADDVTIQTIRNHRPPRIPAISLPMSDTVWVGLEVSTGAYAFQPEFPRRVGDMVDQMIGNRYIGEDGVRVLCSDGVVREMTYVFYGGEHGNMMYRLNVPNDVPNAEWAREHRKGIAVVHRERTARTPLSLSILRPGPAAEEVVQKSFLLGSWGKTTKRLYGWF